LLSNAAVQAYKYEMQRRQGMNPSGKFRLSDPQIAQLNSISFQWSVGRSRGDDPPIVAADAPAVRSVQSLHTNTVSDPPNSAGSIELALTLFQDSEASDKRSSASGNNNSGSRPHKVMAHPQAEERLSQSEAKRRLNWINKYGACHARRISLSPQCT